MAGSIVISIASPNAWSVGSHGFIPIVERIRAAYPPVLQGEEADIFSPMEEGFDMLSLDGLCRDGFTKFASIAQQQMVKLSADHTVEEKWRSALVDAWRGLLDQLRQDPRFNADAGPVS